MEEDPIIEEIRRFREARAAKFNYDIDAIVRDSQRRQFLLNRDLYVYESGEFRIAYRAPRNPDGSLKPMVIPVD